MTGRPVVVWGNCQAEPVAALLRAPMAAHGLDVVTVPPVFLVDEAGLAEVHRTVQQAAVLVTQPVKDEYRFPGCGSDVLADLLPADARVVRFPVTYDTGPFPYQVNAHGGDGARVDAPVTDYHDLRLLAAARRGDDVDAVLAGWPGPAPVTPFDELARESAARLADRERDLDVTVSGLLGAPDTMFTISHPTNRLLADVARQVLAVLGLAGEVDVPTREFLGAVKTPVDPGVAAAMGWPAPTRTAWEVAHHDVTLREVAAAHLAFYAERPDIVADAATRYAARSAGLGL